MNADEMLKSLLALKEQGKDLANICFVANVNGWVVLYPGSLHQSSTGGEVMVMPYQPLPGDRDYQPIE